MIWLRVFLHKKNRNVGALLLSWYHICSPHSEEHICNVSSKKDQFFTKIDVNKIPKLMFLKVDQYQPNSLAVKVRSYYAAFALRCRTAPYCTEIGMNLKVCMFLACVKYSHFNHVLTYMTCVKVITSTYMMFVSICLFYPSVDRVHDTRFLSDRAGHDILQFDFSYF